MENRMSWETFYTLWWAKKEPFKVRQARFPKLVCVRVSCTYKKYLKISDKDRDAVNVYLGWKPEQTESDNGNS